VPRRRPNRLWPIVSFVVLLVVLAADERDGFSRLADLDRGIADAVGSVSIVSLYDDYTHRFATCDYQWLVLCQEKPAIGLELYDAGAAASEAPTTGNWLAGAIGNIPKLPDATFYVLGQRWSQGPIPFAMALLFLIGCIGFAVAAVRGEGNYVLALIAPIVVLVAMWILKHVFLFLADGALLFLEALILLGGIPAAIAGALKFAHESGEVKEGVSRIAESFRQPK